MSSAAELVCSPPTERCGDQLSHHCLNGGLCCEGLDEGLKIKFCVCPTGYEGARCQLKQGDLTQFLEAVQNRDDHIVQAGVSSIISMIVGLLALAACIFLVLVLVRRKLLLKKSSEEDLEKHISDIQQELNSMPTVSKLAQLTRLSKIFQQSARMAVQTTVLSSDVRHIVVNHSPHVDCLPRWSSAPASLSAASPASRPAAVDEVDTVPSPRLEPFVRKNLLHVLSVDVGALERSHQRLQQQQQQGSDVTTRL